MTRWAGVIDNFYAAAVGAWSLQPSEFWKLTIQEFWVLFEWHRKQAEQVASETGKPTSKDYERVIALHKSKQPRK